MNVSIRELAALKNGIVSVSVLVAQLVKLYDKAPQSKADFQKTAQSIIAKNKEILGAMEKIRADN